MPRRASGFPAEIRELLYGGRGKRKHKHRIIFTVSEDTVYVLYVRHTARDELRASVERQIAMLRYLTAGESHGQALTAIVEGFPSGVTIDFALIDREPGAASGRVWPGQAAEAGNRPDHR